jgi:hypothetical protein
MEVIVGVVTFGSLAYSLYRYNFGWWKKHQRFSSKRSEPSLDPFLNKGQKPDDG